MKLAIRGVMAVEGMAPDPEDVIVTTGGQQAIDLITKTLTNPGDPVICEAPLHCCPSSEKHVNSVFVGLSATKIARSGAAVPGCHHVRYTALNFPGTPLNGWPWTFT